MAPVLGYWNLKGLGEQIRLLLKYLGVEFVDKQYKLGAPPTFDKSAWLPDKLSLGFDIPNLPYYIDGDFKLTQSGAIMEYIADVHGMVPECKKQRAVLHMLQYEILDLRMAFARTYYSPDCEKLKPPFLETLEQKLSRFEAFLNEKQWLIGDEINYPDFALCDLLMQVMEFEPCLRKHSILQAYLSRFKNLPELKDYLALK
ncbi:Glutathione S-transferase [Taenia crassiceps]|uniref:glutathione transferase n=1 Tax=Taenia crassiceps TaxID=6207 RepID=A0ABR4Q6D0_9CEST